ncbi:MAG: glycosyl hydrolase [Candidatus Howiella sp.]|jgi:hypothetical protein
MMKKFVVFLLMVVMVLNMVHAVGYSAADGTDALWEQFQTPAAEYKSRPLWFWNDSLENMTKAQIREIMVNSQSESGYFGFGILPNWINNYMSDEYLELYRYALEVAEELGMKMCLYDENGFPSGSAGGLLNQSYPEATIKRLDKNEADVTGPAKGSVPLPEGQYRTYLGAVAMNTDTFEMIDLSDRVVYEEEKGPGIYASSSHPAIGEETFTVDRAFDGNYATRWNAGQGAATNQWIEVVYAEQTTVDRVVIREALNRVSRYAVQYYDGDDWQDIAAGTTIGSVKEISFDAPVTAKRFRLMMYETEKQGELPSIYEMELFSQDQKLARPEADPERVDRVEYDLPEGNYKVMVFATVKDGTDLVDYLSKSDVDKFIEVTHEVYYEQFSEYFGSVIDGAFYDEPPLYRAEGRTWTGNYNVLFEEKYGFDPITLYPALWYDIGEDTEWAKNMLFGFRTELYSENYIKNLNDWCNERGLTLTGHMDAEENVNPVSSSGDLLKIFQNQDIPGVDEVFSYDRARKAYKIVSSAAYNWDKGLVMTETYGGMGEGIGVSTLYKEIMNQFAKGINYVVPHAVWYNNTSNVVYPPELSYRSEQYGPELAAYNEFTARASLLLREGRHVSDIGVLYPINTLQSAYTFDEGDPYRGGVTPEEADYMEVGDLLSGVIRKDFTYLHPEAVADKTTVKGDVLRLDNAVNYEEYRVIILPGSKTISWPALQKIKAFYDAGGKVIATTQLPYKSAEKGHDRDVIDTITEMFGVREESLIGQKTRTFSASSCFQDNPTYAADKAFDGVSSDGSRWNAGDLSGGDEWLQIEFAQALDINRVVLKENDPYRIQAYRIQYWDGDSWETCYTGTEIGENAENSFETVHTDKLRLYIDKIRSDSASIREFEVYCDDSKNLAMEPDSRAEASNAAGGRAVFLGRGYAEELEAVLDEMVETYDVDIAPVETSDGDFTYIHKVKEGRDLYYFANSSDEAVEAEVTVRQAMKKPMLWDPHTGTKKEPDSFVAADGKTTLSFVVEGVHSYFLVDEAQEPVVLSGNADLQALDIGLPLTPAFDKEITAYTAAADGNMREITVSAVAEDPDATVSGTGKQMLHAGSNTLTIEVTAPDGGVKTYTITVVVPVLEGDVDGDGKTTVSDVVLLRQLITAGGAPAASPQELEAGDLDQDGQLTVSDVVSLRGLIISR